MKEKLFELIKEYFDEGIVSELYSGKDMCILNLSDIFYIGCPYFSVEDGNIIAMPIHNTSLKGIVEDESLFFETLRTFTTDVNKYKKNILNLSPSRINVIKEFVETSKLRGPSPFIDHELEEEIRKMTQGKTK